MSQPTVLKLSDKINPDLLEFSAIDLKDEKFYQHASFLKYNGESGLHFKTGWINMSAYGVPHNVDFKQNKLEDKDRLKLKLPLDENQKSCLELKKFLEESGEIMKNSFEPELRRIKEHDDEDDDWNYTFSQPVRKPGKAKKGNKTKFRPLFCTIRYKLDSENGVIVPSLMVKENKKAKGERKTCRTVDEFKSYMNFKCDVRFIVTATKMWCAKNPQAGTDNVQYGITYNLSAAEVVPRTGGSSLSTKFKDFKFDNDDESESSSESNNNNDKNDDKKDSNSDSDSDSDSESDSESSKAEESSDNDSDDNDDDDDSDDDEESESSLESESSEEKPKKKSKKSKKSEKKKGKKGKKSKK